MRSATRKCRFALAAYFSVEAATTLATTSSPVYSTSAVFSAVSRSNSVGSQKKLPHGASTMVVTLCNLITLYSTLRAPAVYSTVLPPPLPPASLDHSRFA